MRAARYPSVPAARRPSCLLLLSMAIEGGIDRALDDSVLMETRRGNDIAGDLRGVAQLDTLGGVDLAIDTAADDDLARGDMRLGHSLPRPRSGGSRLAGSCR